MFHEFLVFELVEGEVKAHLQALFIPSEVCDDAAIHFQLHIGTEVLSTSVLVFVFELYALDIASWNDIRAQSVVEQCDDGSRNHVRTYDAGKTCAS